MSRFDEAIAAFDKANSGDPRQEEGRPYELLYAERLTGWVKKLDPEASEALLLAARSQHIKRWSIPRGDYDKGRIGYLQWRKDLAKFHADTSAEILQQLGYPEETIERVRKINLKSDLKNDPDVQTIEDALCLVFLEHQFSDTADKEGDEKMVVILQKTWKKMSERGREAAKGVSLSEREQALLEKALG